MLVSTRTTTDTLLSTTTLSYCHSLETMQPMAVCTPVEHEAAEGQDQGYDFTLP